MLAPSEGDILDVRLEADDENGDLIGRFKVVRHDKERDLYLMQLTDVRREAEWLETSQSFPKEL